MADEPLVGRDEFVERITPDVLRVLGQIRFFDLLDDRLCPTQVGQRPIQCVHSFEMTRSILADSGMSVEDIQDVLNVLRSQGACCDCEVLYNAVEETRLKARYWNKRHLESRRE